MTTDLQTRSSVQSSAFEPSFPGERLCLPTLAPEVQSKIGAGVEMPVLSSEILDERSEQDPDGLRLRVL